MNPHSLLPILAILPLVGGLLLLAPWKFTGAGESDKAGGVSPGAGYALVGTLFNFAVSLWLAFSFDWANPGATQFNVALPWVDRFGLSFGFGVDAMSLWLVLLTTFLMPLVVLGSFKAVSQRSREYYMWLLILEAAMIGTFVATDLVFFYICFEFTLIPLFFLIGIWGSKQRLRAAKVFFLYTFTGSVLTLAGVLYVAWFFTTLSVDNVADVLKQIYFLDKDAARIAAAKLAGHWTFDIRTLAAAASHPQIGMSDVQQTWVMLALLAGFAVKVPLFPVHTWLPLAHTEAPTSGSVILAGVLLKLGTYGLLRFAIPMCPHAVVEYAPVIGTLAVIGILYTALICWVQKDIKKLIAYSSVSHLGFCVLGMFALGQGVIGQTGSVMYMVNHGLSTGALFLCVGMIYERFHTREMRQYGGLAKVMPVWSFFMVFFCLASVGLPGLNGFVGEFLTLLGAFNARATLGPGFAAIAGVGMILGAIYILYMVGKVVFGPTRVPTASHGDAHGHDVVKDLTGREVAVLVPLAIACIVLGLYPKPMLQSLEPSMSQLTAAANRVIDRRAVAKSDDTDTQLPYPSRTLRVRSAAGGSTPPRRFFAQKQPSATSDNRLAIEARRLTGFTEPGSDKTIASGDDDSDVATQAALPRAGGAE